ncbi:NADP-dependent oxidoreductase domain-containing protein [Apiospora sp. TS-2023a]
MEIPPKEPCGLSHDLTLPNSSSPHTTTTPRLVYGTAWKKNATADLVYKALKFGFRGIDTAAQPRHYQERLVGDGVRRAVAEGLVARGELYLQTKFTSIHGQDPDGLPYDPRAPIEEQVRASVASSLENLAIPPSPSSREGGNDNSYLDCVVLHSPLPTLEETVAAWQALEKYVPHRIRHLGIANAPQEIVEYLLSSSPSDEGAAQSQSQPELAVRFPPSVVQNRFHRETGYETSLRRLCRDHGVVFQTFWTLTGNGHLVKKSDIVGGLADRVPDGGVSRETAFYALVLGLRGTSILDGTTSEEHMRADLEGIRRIERWADGEGREMWEDTLNSFKRLIKEE